MLMILSCSNKITLRQYSLITRPQPSYPVDIYFADDQKLNNGKCVSMTCTRSPSSTSTVYYTSEHALEIVDQYNYLGVRLYSSMMWSYHIQLRINKATKVLDFIKPMLRGVPIGKF